ncbi:MAG: hypothetical protein WC582_01825 [Patescibacteria group bacterium]|jgi:hypothetical protein
MKNGMIMFAVIVIALFHAEIVRAQQSLINVGGESTREKSAHFFSLFMDVRVNKNYSHKLEMRQDWPDLFLPQSAKMTRRHVGSINLGFGMGYNRRLFGNDKSWQIRLPISYEIFSFNAKDGDGRFAKELISGTVLEWWDPVMAKDLVAQHFTPRVGIEIAKKDFGIGFSVQHYRLLLRDFRGEDRIGAPNLSHVMSSREIESGASFQIDVFFWRKEGWVPIDFYVETTRGFKTASFGIITSFNKRWRR